MKTEPENAVLIANTDGDLLFWCPGCEGFHSFRTAQSKGKGPTWQWNNDLVKPTFTPSLLVTGYIEDKKVPLGGRPVKCHSYVRGGSIQFLGDCEHKLRGQTVPLEPVGQKLGG